MATLWLPPSRAAFALRKHWSIRSISPKADRDDHRRNHDATVAGRATLQMEGHVIVCGLKGVGLRTVEQLHFSGVRVVVVDEDPDPKLARIVEGWGVEQIHRNANLGYGLSDAGLYRAVAVVCAEANDLATVELALQVHEARPDVRLVVQVTVSEDEGYNRTFRSHFGNLAPVAIAPADGSELIICPERDQPVSAGDRVSILGTPEEFERSDLDIVRALHVVPPPASIFLKLRRRFAGLMETNAKGLVVSTISLVVLLAVATTIVRIWFVDPTTQQHLGLITSTYFAIETIATVGFGDFYFGGQNSWLEAVAVVFIVLGVTSSRQASLFSPTFSSVAKLNSHLVTAGSQG